MFSRGVKSLLVVSCHGKWNKIRLHGQLSSTTEFSFFFYPSKRFLKLLPLRPQKAIFWRAFSKMKCKCCTDLYRLCVFVRVWGGLFLYSFFLAFLDVLNQKKFDRKKRTLHFSLIETLIQVLSWRGKELIATISKLINSGCREKWIETSASNLLATYTKQRW